MEGTMLLELASKGSSVIIAGSFLYMLWLGSKVLTEKVQAIDDTLKELTELIREDIKTRK